MLKQCHALLALKWAILCHTWSAGHTISALIVGFILTVMLSLSLGLAVILHLSAPWLLEQGGAMGVMLALDIMIFFLLFFMVFGLMLELQRTDVIDFKKMLFLPVSPRMIFALNFLAALITPSLCFFLPAAVGLLSGLAVQEGPRLLLGLPLALALYLMLAAWLYYLRGILAIFMENKRKRRLVLTLLPLFFIALGQLPNLLTHTFRTGENEEERLERSSSENAEQLRRWNLAIPFGWFPYGVNGLIQGAPEQAAFAFLGLSLFGGLGLGLGYRSTLRHYTGANTSSGRSGAKAGTAPRTRPLTARRLPLLSEDTGGMALAEFLNALRHPNVRMAMIMPVCLGLFLMVMYRTGMYKANLNPESPWLPIMVLLWPFLHFAFILFNIFGIDRQGFSGLMLLPAPRHRYLFAKNLALFPFAGGVSLLFVLLAAVLLKLPGYNVEIALLQVFHLYMMYCILGNYLSLYAPYRIARDTMRAYTNRLTIFLTGLASTLMVTVMLLPTTGILMLDSLIEKRYASRDLPAGMIAAIALLFVTAALYRVTLTHAGDILLSREQKIYARLYRDRE